MNVKTDTAATARRAASRSASSQHIHVSKRQSSSKLEVYLGHLQVWACLWWGWVGLLPIGANGSQAVLFHCAVRQLSDMHNTADSDRPYLRGSEDVLSA